MDPASGTFSRQKRRSTPRQSRRPTRRDSCRLLAALLATAAAMRAGAGAAQQDAPGGAADGSGGSLRVGAKPDGQQALLASMTAQLLQARDIPVERVTPPMPTAAVRAALKRGDIDLYWEETGTALTIFYRRRPPLGPEASLTTLRKDDAEEGLVWLEPSRIDNRFVMVMRRAEATSLGLKGLSDLGARFAEGWEMSLATDDEFFARPDGLKPLQTFYKFTWPQERVVRLPPQRPIQALLDGDVNAAIVRESDGVLSRADMLDLVRLEDDRGFYPPYLATPVVREDALRRFPGIVEPLDHLARVLDNDVMREMALRLTERPEDVDAIARAFLEVANLLPR